MRAWSLSIKLKLRIRNVLFAYERVFERFGFEIRKISPRTIPINILPMVIKEYMDARSSTAPFTFVQIVEHETRYDYGPAYAGRGIPETFSIDAAHHTPYGISKLVGELYVREFGGVANRCSCMYGPNQFGIVDQGWMSHIATNKILGRPTIIYGDGKQVRDALHVDDVVRLLLLQASAILGGERSRFAGEVFNAGGGVARTISLLELCRKWEIEPDFGQWRPADQKVFYCDIAKAKNILGWEPVIGLEEGLADLYRWTQRTLTTT